jgi:predicted nucleic acid-binding protein
MERDFDRVKRILLPALGDWTQAGRVRARLAARDGYEKIEQGRLANDALIAMSAARRGATVITAKRARLRQARRISCLPTESGYSLIYVGREY